jgi:hypothetical protein
MDNPEILDSLYREAVSAIEAGDVSALERLSAAHPKLMRERLDLLRKCARVQLHTMFIQSGSLLNGGCLRTRKKSLH